ncbi:MAG: hypothetical protein ACRERR_06475 [Moraxellaceae bacterium]
MATRFGALLLAAALLPLSGLIQAGPEQEAAHGSFSEDTTRTMADGRVFKRHVEQKAQDEGFSRKEVLTSPEGKTASHTVSRRFDASTQRWIVQEEGVGFDGKTWSRVQQGEPELPVFGDVPKPVAVAEAARVTEKATEKAASPPKPTGPKRREFR